MTLSPSFPASLDGQKILIVEDQLPVAMLLEHQIREELQGDLTVKIVETMAETLKALDGTTFAACVLDLGLPDSEGLETLRQVRDAAPDMPVVVLSGDDRQETALEALQMGAVDFINKMSAPPRLVARKLGNVVARQSLTEDLKSAREMVQAMMDGAASGIITIDSTGQILSFNNAAADMFGFSATEVIGRNVSILMPDYLAAEHDGYVGRYVTGGAPRIVGIGREVTARRRNGTLFPVHLAISDIAVRGHRLLTGVLTDLTQLKAAQSALEEAQRLARVGSWEQDVATGALSWSDEIYRIFGREPQSFAPEKAAFLEAVHPDDREAVLASEQRAIQGGRHDVEHRIILPDGSQKWVHELAVVEFAPEGGPLRMRGTVQDVTARRGAEEALRRQINGLTALGEVMSARDRPLGEQLRRALAVGCRHLGLDVGIVSRIDGDRYAVHEQVSPEEFGLQTGQEFDLRQTYCDMVMTSGDLVAITHMGVSDAAGHPCYRAFALESYIGLTVHVGNAVHGTINFSSPRPRETPFDDGDRLFMGLLARWIGAAMDHERAQEDLRGSQERLMRSQSFANIGTWDWNIRTGDLFWSDRIPPLFGYPEGELETSYENFQAAVHPDDREMVAEAVAACIESGAEYDIEHRVVWPDGTVRWLSEKGDVVRDANGKALHMLGLVQDITRAKDAEAALREFQRVIEASEQGVGIAAMDGRLTYVNPAHARIFKMPAESLVGRPFRDLMVGDEADAITEALMAAVAAGGGWNGLLPVRDAEGRAFPLQSSVSAIRDEDGTPTRVFNIMSDYTEELRRQDDLRAARDAAEAANQAKSEFLSRMSHELRTPLNAILGFAELMEISRKDPVSERQKGYLSHIRSGGRHLLSLINDVLDLARIEAGRISLSPEPVEARALLDDCLAATRALAGSRGVSVTDETAAATLPWLHVDLTRAKQVLLNLLSNAVKYNRPEGTVTVRAEAQGNRLRLSVADTGFGIPLDRQDEVFKPFSRLGQENGTIEGTGIGLSIARRLVREMGGDMGFASVQDEGSVFWAEFPITSQVRGGAVREADGAPQAQANAPQQGRRRILYVEDNPANMALMAEIIADLDGMVLLPATSAEVGLAVARAERPDVILMDVNLPGMDGFMALDALRADARTRHIPVIALSADAMPSTVRRGETAGFRAYLTKPVNLPELLAAFDAAFDAADIPT